ncbi:transcriptional regulator [Nostoc sp. FACHB-87]|uniref:P-II family nitrogen regulator n=1 Tax=Nostocales TaxID=1161 RepID=UPI001688C1A8|nr:MULTISPECIES: P-II family nitrogen regulator [Nostocales]MBD2455629.1 transcriptional regulator [Nostoc sp. FACHB-87]MBD2477260.1 transcriptional regulator [Anabaena sp. FACHB-83]MBD2490664.1 transcriptional regulator [Aulosira sp. FACHB-615]
MEAIKKVEIVTNSLELPKVLDILEKIGVSGYTVIEDVTGKGDRGRVFNDLESHILTNGYIMSVCTQEQEEELVTEIEPILKKFGGVCIVSDAKWIAH